jgi:hypothetical protein
MTTQSQLDATYKTLETVSARVSAFVITHPEKDGYALVQLAYPKDGAGRLRVLVRNGFATKENGQPSVQCGTAGGYGYDKACAAMSGLVIDGIELADHCGGSDADKAKAASLLKTYRHYQLGGQTAKALKVHDKAHALGFSFANYAAETGCYTSCYVRAGLGRLRDCGYSVIQAI